MLLPSLRNLRAALCASVLGLLATAPAAAHVALLPVAGKKLDMKTDAAKPKKNKFNFQTDKKQNALLVTHDPVADGFRLLVVADSGDHSELITLDTQLWEPIGKPGNVKGWKYKDKNGTRAGIQKAQIKNGQLKIKAKGVNWTFAPDGTETGYEVWVRLQDEWYCSEFGGSVKKNEQGRFKAVHAPAPGACADQVCGNGQVEFGEECDDGDLDDEDGCTAACEVVSCSGETFDSTFDAIQDVVLEGYGCTSDICHGQADHQSKLSLWTDDPDANHAALVNVPADGVLGTLVLPGDKDASFFYEKLAAATLGTPTTGTEMPVGGALTEEHLDAVGEWIRTGADRNASVQGTAELLGSCLPPATPLKIDPPLEPGEGVGVQFRSSGWSLPAQSENEVCMPTYYDFTQTNLVPVSEQFDCPGVFGPNNPSDKCFRYHRQLLLQDAQSHHSIIHIYTGDGDPNGVGVPPNDGSTTDPGWGTWTYKMNDVDDPLNGTPCDPTAVDPATGTNEGCSGTPKTSAACIFNYGPADWNTGDIGGGGGGGGNTAYQFSGSQETHYDQEFADGVYSTLPMQGILTWNSHAFNLTDFDTSMAQYLNLWLAGLADQLYPLQGIFDASEIFIQDVPPFETREYCHVTTPLPDGANLFWLSSHTHRFGVQWRTWLPPNAACSPGDCTGGSGAPGVCCPSGEAPDYFSTQYNDPVQMAIEPPLVLSGSTDDRRLLFCSLYDNGSGAGSPPVKQRSTSPIGPSFGFLGGPCGDDTVACMDGPNKGQLCGGDDSFCDSSPGAGDGRCDACPVLGGLTTEDEMFILLGNFFVP